MPVQQSTFQQSSNQYQQIGEAKRDEFVTPDGYQAQTMCRIPNQFQPQRYPQYPVQYSNVSSDMIHYMRHAQQKRNNQLVQHLEMIQEEAKQQKFDESQFDLLSKMELLHNIQQEKMQRFSKRLSLQQKVSPVSFPTIVAPPAL